MNSFFVFIALFGTLAQAWRWPWQKPDTPEWNALSVTFKKWSGLPMKVKDAEEGGWTLTRPCDASNYFSGNRYVLKGDTAAMLLFDSNGKIAGIQNGIPKSAVGDLKAPWVSEGNMYVITAYFTDPKNLCGGSRPSLDDSFGDQLLVQAGTQSSNTMSIPFKQEDLAGTKWVRGGCIPGMGRHYWYNISPDLSCTDFFPVFLLYNKDRLTGFGWVSVGNADSPRYEHPPPKKLGFRLGPFSFFQKGTMPTCISDLKALTTQHVYLNKRPYLNLCAI